MSPAEQTAREVLAKLYGPLTDPRYAPDPQKAELLLRKAVREIWREHGEHLPGWVVGYVRKWSNQGSA